MALFILGRDNILQKAYLSAQSAFMTGAPRAAEQSAQGVGCMSRSERTKIESLNCPTTG